MTNYNKNQTQGQQDQNTQKDMNKTYRADQETQNQKKPSVKSEDNE